MENLNNINYERAEDLKRLDFIQSCLDKFGAQKIKVLDVEMAILVDILALKDMMF